jgi:NAD(P)-dependent dehydrogenase (short-subunit alcohol dehydrogenase family)
MHVAITGAASGIGKEVATKLKSAGHTVDAFDINEPQSDVDRWVKTDMSDSASIHEAVAEAGGPYDALINNAGVPPRDGLQEKILQVNFFGARAFLYAMLDKLSDGASVVNTASRAGAHWRDNLEQVTALLATSENELPAFIEKHNIDPTRAYNLSKEALIVMTMADTEQMIARGLRINSVSPAAVSTGILDDFYKAFGDRVAKNVARAGRPGEPHEIADVIAFLASPRSAWIKGQDLVIDGGMSAMAASDALALKATNVGG